MRQSPIFAFVLFKGPSGPILLPSHLKELPPDRVSFEWEVSGLVDVLEVEIWRKADEPERNTILIDLERDRGKEMA